MASEHQLQTYPFSCSTMNRSTSALISKFIQKRAFNYGVKKSDFADGDVGFFVAVQFPCCRVWFKLWRGPYRLCRCQPWQLMRKSPASFITVAILRELRWITFIWWELPGSLCMCIKSISSLSEAGSGWHLQIH